MPIVGINCKYRGNVSLQQCLDCETEVCNACVKTYRTAMFQNIEYRAKMISASMIFSCPLKTYLYATTDIYEDIEQLHWGSWRGSLIHGMLEKCGELDEEFLTEKRFYMTIKGVKISGKIDSLRYTKELQIIQGEEGQVFEVPMFDKTQGILYDYKTTAKIYKAYLPNEEHVKQLSIYVLLLKKAGIKVNRACLFYIDGKGTQPVWSGKDFEIIKQGKLLEMMAPRLKVLQKMFKENKPPEPEVSFLCDKKNKNKVVYCAVRHLCPAWAHEYKNRGKKQ